MFGWVIVLLTLALFSFSEMTVVPGLFEVLCSAAVVGLATPLLLRRPRRRHAT